MKTGIVFGAFDLLHAGHINLLRKCKDNCDELIVGLHVNPKLERVRKNIPIESLIERLIKLQSCLFVNYIIPYEKESDIEVIFNYYKPDIRFLGSDYKRRKKNITAPNAVPIIYIDSLPIHTSDIRKRIKKAK